ncbi:MAG TPA: hypothetical protein VKA46_12605 [Gemmataceae bacterium]|nr:hypothetical protein [Gemmataceae bacterium]
MQKRRWWWLLGLIAIPLAAWAFDRSLLSDWVGGTDLEIEFVITDVDSGEHVEAAEVLVFEEIGLYREAKGEPFTLVTGQDGTARRVCHDDLCSGKQSRLGFTHTYHVAWPSWCVQISAPGYESSKPVWLLDMPEERRHEQHLGPMRDKLTVRLPIRKIPP